MAHIDEHCNRGGKVAEPYDCTLNMTDLKTNKNKFYIMQIIQESSNSYTLFIRYGRIGEIGRISYQSGSLESCVSKFKTQFKSKTKNAWDTRDKFTRFKDKYYLCDKQVAVPENDTALKLKEEEEKKPDVPDSQLDPRVVNFLELIGDIKMLRQTLTRLNIDTRKMPLGAISSSQLDKADEILDQIQAVLDKTSHDDLLDLSSEYYTYVPMATSRSWRPPPVNSQASLDEAREKLEDLRNLKIAYSAVEEKRDAATVKVHPADTLYEKLDTDIMALDRSDPMWSAIEKYVFQTQGATHHCRVKLVDIYQIGRNQEKRRLSLMGNLHLLWHGTRLSNYISIMQNGLVLRPELLKSGVHITGKMFGYGIYGANSFSKSFNYTYTERGQEACLFLGEFALGKVLEKTQADYYLNKDSLKQQGGYHSTWGQGQWSPDGHEEIKKVKVPNGQLAKSGVQNASLMYDEFIVYDEKQVKLKYIVRVRSE